MPVATFFSVTVALGNAAPDESVMVPSTVAVSNWANAAEANEKTASIAKISLMAEKVEFELFIHSSESLILGVVFRVTKKMKTTVTVEHQNRAKFVSTLCLKIRTWRSRCDRVSNSAKLFGNLCPIAEKDRSHILC